MKGYPKFRLVRLAHGLNLNRRAVLAGLPAAILGAGDAQAQEAESPVMALFQEWKVAFDRVEALVTDGWSQSRIDAEVHEVDQILEQMVATPSRDARDVCAKLTAFTYDGECFADDDGRLSGPILREAQMAAKKRGFTESPFVLVVH